MRQAAEYVTKEVYSFDIYIGSPTDPENGRHMGTVFINPDDAKVRLPRPACRVADPTTQRRRVSARSDLSDRRPRRPA